MTGIQEDAGGEEDELQFHLELDGGIPPASTVTTHGTFILNRYKDLDSSWATEGLVLGKPVDSPHEPEPPVSLHFSCGYLDKTQSSFTAMAAQAIEALNRTFIELKSKNDETRVRASHDLRDLVVSAARGKAFCPSRILHWLIDHGHSATFGQIPRVLQYGQ